MQVKHYLTDMLEPEIVKLGYEMVRIITIGQMNPTLQVMIDRTDGKDVSVDDCAKVSRALSAVLDEKDPIASKYTLEVSSPGLDRPLTKPEHFSRFAGNTVKIETDELIENRKRFKGVLQGLEGQDVNILAEDGIAYKIPFAAIAKAKIVLTDELLAKWEAEHGTDEEIIE